VAYQSTSTNLVAGTDTNNRNDVFLYDRATGINTLVSHAWNAATTAGNLASDLDVDDDTVNRALISADGRYVAYTSQAGNLVEGFVDGNGQNLITASSIPGDVFLYDRLTGTNVLASRSLASATASGNVWSAVTSMSGDGRFVTFIGSASDLTADVRASASSNVYQYDRKLGTVTLVSRAVDGVTITTNLQSGPAQVSRDGTSVVFTSDAYNLVAGDFNGFTDVFQSVTPPPRVQSVAIADGSAQRSVIRSLTVTFDQPVFFAGEPAAAFELTSPAGSVQLAAGGVTGSSVTLTFGGSLTEFGSLIDGKYTLRVRADQVSNIGPLDGNNDGVGGDDFTVNFHRLFGDADGNGFVDALDFRAFRGALGSAAFVFDFDGDGDADAADFGAFRGRFGMALP
jgi:hypothetical protein